VVLLIVVTVVATALRSGSSSSNTAAALASVPPTQLAPNVPPAPRGLATAPGNLVLDVSFGDGGIADPEGLGHELKLITGVVEHGLFCGLTTGVILAGPGGVRVLGNI